MDSKTASSAVSGPLAAMFQNANIDNKAEKSEFSNSARDMFKFAVNNYFNFAKEGENLVLESSDTIDFFRNVVQPFLAEVRKGDQSRSTAAETTGEDASGPADQEVTIHDTVEGVPVDIIDLVPPEPSSLPVASVADRYTRSMLNCLAGYPLYEPQPFSELSTEYLSRGVTVGDVGFVRGDGTFDFLFNVCPSKNSSINPSKLPDGFSLETSEYLATRPSRPLPHKTRLFQSPVTRTKSGEYICEGSEGAILELPEGATEDEATNIRPFAKLAARYGVEWYKYTMIRGRDISNGALYLITSFTKCAQWGIAVLDRKCAPGQGLKFSKKRFLPFGKSKYEWTGSRIFSTKVSDLSQGDVPNQCVFLRGFKIMIRQDIFDNLCNDQHHSTMALPLPQVGSYTVKRERATRIRGGGGADPTPKALISKGLFSPTRKMSNEVVLHANFNSSIVHPSDIINAALLSQNLNANVAVTHDDVWCNLLRGNFPKLNYATLISVAQSYTTTVDEYDCVFLEKISDSRNVPDEKNHPLRNETAAALQLPLTTPDENYVGVPATSSLTLPRELVERILLLLDTKSMLKCRLVSSEFNQIIQSSIVLQYFLACKAAGVTDNPRSPLSYTERLEALKKREEAWRTLVPVFETTIKVNHQPYSIYGLTAGTYFRDDNNQKDLHYCYLPSSPQENPHWSRIPVHGPVEGWSGIFVNFGIAVYEYDLITNIISSEIGNQADMQRHSLDLVLLQFSTGQYHPLARHPRIHVQISPVARPDIYLEVVGDNLAVSTNGRGMSTSKLFIFDWKTGHKRLQHETIESAYPEFVFISPELLLIPNIILSHFEVWHLPPFHPDPKAPVQILSLKIPSVSPDYFLSEVSCSGAPSPFLYSMPYFPPRPFFTSPEKSVIIVELGFDSLQGFEGVTFTLIMHRGALLDTIQKWTLPSDKQQDSSMWLTNEVTVHKITDIDDGSVRLGPQSKLVSTMPHPRIFPPTRDSPALATFPNSPTLHISADTSSSSISESSKTLSTTTTQYDFCVVQWTDWGPPVSRWFRADNVQWIMSSNGQRYVFSNPHPHDERKLMISVADFNPYNFRRHAERMVQLKEGNNGSGNGKSGEAKKEEKKEELESELEILNHRGVFAEEVYMGLKCVVYHAPGEYDFDVVLMDEERLLGVKVDGEDKGESIKVLYFG